MTRLKLMRKGTPEEIAEMLCESMEDTFKEEYYCDFCPAKLHCRDKHIGFIDWLKEEVSNAEKR